MNVHLTKDEAALLRVGLASWRSLLVSRDWRETQAVAGLLNGIERKLNRAELVGRYKKTIRRMTKS